MRLVSIPTAQYDEYRLTLMFDCYKWDPQFLDNNTIAKYALVLTKEEDMELQRLTESLDQETRKAEEFLNQHLELTKPLALPKSVSKEIKKMKNYEPDRHIRLMRYDFHPTTNGKWAISEVNSDVPGGFAESSLMPQAAMTLFPKEQFWHKDFGDMLVQAIMEKVPEKCTSYMRFSDLRLARKLFDGEVNAVACVGEGKIRIGGIISQVDNVNRILDRVALYLG